MRFVGDMLWGDTIAPGWVEIEASTIVAAGREDVSGDREAGVIAPALCDLQVNGAAGVEVTDGEEALDRIDRALLRRGIARYLATVVTTSDDIAARAVHAAERRMHDPSSPLVGVHLEGPFLNPARAGAHAPRLLRTPSDGVPDYYWSPAVRLVTLAPELSGALELAHELARRGIAVALGHSDATPAIAERAFSAGATLVTHLFNAMAPLHHRKAGLAAWALAHERIAVSVIGDGRHVDPLVLRFVRRAGAERVLLVSDASAAAAAPEGRYRLAGREIISEGGVVRDAQGRLAGSATTLDAAVGVWSQRVRAPLGEALAAAGERPARLLGVDVRFAPGAPADLVLVSPDGRVRRVMRRGAWL